MGTQVLGSTTTPSGGTYYINAASAIIKSNSSATVPAGGIYIDGIYAYCGSYSGTQSLQFSCYNYPGNSGALLFGSSPISYGTGYSWKSAAIAVASGYVSGGQLVSVAVYGPNNIELQGTNFGTGGSFWYHTGSGWPNPFTGGTQITTVGDMAWYCTYFPPASISGYPTSPVIPGSNFSVSGASFTAGVNSINIGGTACPGWTVNSDSSLTVTAPSSGAQGQLEVVTNAGNAYSSGNMIVGQVWVNRSGVTAPIAIYIPNGGGVQSVKGVWVPNGGGVKRIW